MNLVTQPFWARRQAVHVRLADLAPYALDSLVKSLVISIPEAHVEGILQAALDWVLERGSVAVDCVSLVGNNYQLLEGNYGGFFLVLTTSDIDPVFPIMYPFLPCIYLTTH